MPTTIKLSLPSRHWLAKLWERDLRFDRVFLPNQRLAVSERATLVVTTPDFPAAFELEGTVRAEVERGGRRGVEVALSVRPRQVSALEAYLAGYEREALILLGGDAGHDAIASAFGEGGADDLVARVGAALVRCSDQGGRAKAPEPPDSGALGLLPSSPLQQAGLPRPPSTGAQRSAVRVLDQLFEVLAEDAATRRQPTQAAEALEDAAGRLGPVDLDLLDMVATSTFVEARTGPRSSPPPQTRGPLQVSVEPPYTRVREPGVRLARSPEADPYGLVSEAEQRVAKETVAAMAHRFNSLLGAVVLGAKTLQGDLDPEHPLAEVAANMADTALQAGALAEALLGAVGRRLPPGHGRVRSLFRLNSVVSEALEVWGGFPGNAEVVVELDPLVGSVRGQKEQLTLALHDIFSSVVDALSDGGQVSIRTLAVGRGRRLWAEVAVEYTSRSAAADVAEPPLVPWTASVRSGKGLGLAVAVGMAANHGGKVELQHVAPNTVRITVELPTADVPKVARSTGRRSKGGTEAILIVDDEPQIRKIGRRLLERLGYRVAVAANGQAAVDLLNDPDTAAFDLAVLDLTMPGMSTPELFRRLKERLPNLKVVLFTGCDLDSIATSLLNEGADAFLQKPDGAASLPKVVRRLLDGRSVPRA